MDAKFINPFINAPLNVLETMASTKAEAGKTYLKKNQVASGDGSTALAALKQGRG
jgi:CheY-specific phosphatase CheX